MRRSVILLAAAVTLAGCARDEAAYPSLARRAAEGQGFAEPAVAAPDASAPDPSLDMQLREFGEALAMTRRSFDGDAGRAEQAAGAAGARTVGSEAWLDAQAALARLDDWRARTSGIQTGLDDMARRRAEAVGAPYPPLEAMRARAEEEVARQSERAAAIAARLPTP